MLACRSSRAALLLYKPPMALSQVAAWGAFPGSHDIIHLLFGFSESFPQKAGRPTSCFFVFEREITPPGTGHQKVPRSCRIRSFGLTRP